MSAGLATAPPPRARLTLDETWRGLRLSIVEGVLFALMVGLAETYLVADAVRLGASTLMLGVVVSVPLFVGSFGPLLCLRLLTWVRRRKPLVAASNVLQGALWWLLAANDHAGTSSPTLLVVAFTAHHFLGQFAGTAWTSWFGDLVPSGVRGSFVARRNRAIYGTIALGILAGGLVLEWAGARADADAGLGFAIVFAIAGTCRIGCAFVVARMPEPRFPGLAGAPRVKRFLRTDRGRRAWRLVALVFAIQLSVYLSGPYYVPFMLDELAFDYSQFTAASLIVFAVKVLVLPRIGRAIDGAGPRTTFRTTLVLLALVPLPWVFADGFGVILVAQAFSGLAWGGYEVSLFGLLIASSYRDTRPHLVAVQQIANGTGQLLGGLAGAGIAELAAGDLRTVFAISCAARLAVAFVAPLALPVGRGEVLRIPRRLVLRVSGARPGGGIGLRPMVPALPEEMVPEAADELDAPVDARADARADPER